MSVITADFADRALRKKIQSLLDQADAKMTVDPVSYTHLTLPTICSV